MKDLTGYMTINGKDAWTEYSAFLCEDRREDSFNFSELLKPLEMKEYTSVDFRERNGEELPEVLPAPCFKGRDVSLYMAVHATSLGECEARCAALMNVFYAGWVELQLKGLPSVYRLYYKASSDAGILTEAGVNGITLKRWKMKFREPKPAVFEPVLKTF